MNTSPTRTPHYLALDRGTQKIGWAHAYDADCILLGGYFDNDSMMHATLSQIVISGKYTDIIMGVARLPEPLAKRQQRFVIDLGWLFPDCIVHHVDESYTSVQARDRLGDFTKSYRDDAVSAMIILERFFAEQE